MEAEDFVDSISKDEPVPEELIFKLIQLVGDEYDGRVTPISSTVTEGSQPR